MPVTRESVEAAKQQQERERAAVCKAANILITADDRIIILEAQS